MVDIPPGNSRSSVKADSGPPPFQPLLIVLLFFAPTVHYRVELGLFSFAVLEPITLMVVAVFFSHQFITQKRIVILRDPIAHLFIAITLWAILVRPWSMDWKHGLSDIRDWAVPTLGFLALTSTVRCNWRRWIWVYIIIVWFNALFGIYQYLTDGFRPFVTAAAEQKTGFTVAPGANQLMLVSYAAGFFANPNGFAMYVFPGLMIGCGFLVQGGNRLMKLTIVTTISLALYWSYAKASLLVTAAVMPLFWIQRRLRSDYGLLAIIGAGAIAALAGLWIAVQVVPPIFLDTIWWRVGLWETAIEIFSERPSLIFTGNGMDQFASQAYHGQPHNLYLYMSLEYGLFGLIWVVVLGSHLFRRGLKLRRLDWEENEPLLSAIWLALLGYLCVGFVESNLMGVETRMLFALLAACFVGLSHEVETKTQPSPCQGGQSPML